MARQVHEAVILSGASQSSIIDCGSEYTLVGLDVPTITSAAITFLGASHTGRTPGTTFGQSVQDVLETQLTFRPLVNEAGVEISIAAATGNIVVALPDGMLEGVQFLKIRSGTSAAPVVQAADRTLRATVSE